MNEQDDFECEELLRKIFEENLGVLSEELPSGYTEHNMGRNDEVDALLNILVIKVHTNFGEDEPTWPKPWIGAELVYRWYELENGKAISWVRAEPWEFIVRDL